MAGGPAWASGGVLLGQAQGTPSSDTSFTAPAAGLVCGYGGLNGCKIEEIDLLGSGQSVAGQVNIFTLTKLFALVDKDLFTANNPTAGSTTVAPLRFIHTYSNLVLPPAIKIGTLTTALTAGTAATSLALSGGIVFPVPKFGGLIITTADGTTTQGCADTPNSAAGSTGGQLFGIVASAASALAATSIAVDSFIPKFSFLSGALVYLAPTIFVTSNVGSQPLTVNVYGGSL